jgi:hypothetical protein
MSGFDCRAKAWWCLTDGVESKYYCLVILVEAIVGEVIYLRKIILSNIQTTKQNAVQNLLRGLGVF